jgi:hypothetical protein
MAAFSLNYSYMAEVSHSTSGLLPFLHNLVREVVAYCHTSNSTIQGQQELTNGLTPAAAKQRGRAADYLTQTNVTYTSQSVPVAKNI